MFYIQLFDKVFDLVFKYSNEVYSTGEYRASETSLFHVCFCSTSADAYNDRRFEEFKRLFRLPIGWVLSGTHILIQKKVNGKDVSKS